MNRIEQIMRQCPVIPVLAIDDVRNARPIAQALVAGGLRVLEVTLRTAAAFEVIQEMKGVPGAIVGAGTVLNTGHLRAAMTSGATFIVSPGLTEPLGRAAVESGVPFLPGIATASELMRGFDLGFTHFKFFPAEAAGGRAALRALAAPFSAARFCPTGGITQQSAQDWLDLPQVLCVGGSWLVGSTATDLPAITAAATAATALRAA